MLINEEEKLALLLRREPDCAPGFSETKFLIDAAVIGPEVYSEPSESLAAASALICKLHNPSNAPEFVKFANNTLWMLFDLCLRPSVWVPVRIRACEHAAALTRWLGTVFEELRPSREICRRKCVTILNELQKKHPSELNCAICVLARALAGSDWPELFDDALTQFTRGDLQILPILLELAPHVDVMRGEKLMAVTSAALRTEQSKSQRSELLAIAKAVRIEELSSLTRTDLLQLAISSPDLSIRRSLCDIVSAHAPENWPELVPVVRQAAETGNSGTFQRALQLLAHVGPRIQLSRANDALLFETSLARFVRDSGGEPICYCSELKLVVSTIFGRHRELCLPQFMKFFDASVFGGSRTAVEVMNEILFNCCCDESDSEAFFEVWVQCYIAVFEKYVQNPKISHETRCAVFSGMTMILHAHAKRDLSQQRVVDLLLPRLLEFTTAVMSRPNEYSLHYLNQTVSAIGSFFQNTELYCLQYSEATLRTLVAVYNAGHEFLCRHAIVAVCTSAAPFLLDWAQAVIENQQTRNQEFQIRFQSEFTNYFTLYVQSLLLISDCKNLQQLWNAMPIEPYLLPFVSDSLNCFTRKFNDRQRGFFNDDDDDGDDDDNDDGDGEFAIDYAFHPPLTSMHTSHISGSSQVDSELASVPSPSPESAAWGAAMKERSNCGLGETITWDFQYAFVGLWNIYGLMPDDDALAKVVWEATTPLVKRLPWQTYGSISRVTARRGAWAFPDAATPRLIAGRVYRQCVWTPRICADAFTLISAIASVFSDRFARWIPSIKPILHNSMMSSCEAERIVCVEFLTSFIFGMKTHITPYTHDLLAYLPLGLADESAEVRAGSACCIGGVVEHSTDTDSVRLSYHKLFPLVRLVLTAAGEQQHIDNCIYAIETIAKKYPNDLPVTPEEVAELVLTYRS